MSDVIRLLPEVVANQIAAGEVIQRPASVVKELMENAVDAGAAEIQVLVTDAGKSCIQVIDDGKGMSPADACLAFERHATSKIKEAADLFALHTLGFRGEALASIAAVAEVELKTRQAGEELGTRVAIVGSHLETQEAIACPQGANFSVKNLFFNVPARRKFLKGNVTEENNILTEFERVALVHPEVALRLYKNGTELLHLPAMPLRQRILTLFGKKMNEQLLPLSVDTTLVKLSGYIAKPETARKKGNRQYFFVNGRYMRHPYFHRAVMEAYEGLVPAGLQLSYFIYFEVDAANIDVNIHPTKTEIKFENEQAIWQILMAAVKEALGRFSAVPTIDFDTTDRPDIPMYDRDHPATPPQVHYNPDYNPFKKNNDGYNRGGRTQDVNWEALYGGLEKAGMLKPYPPQEAQGMYLSEGTPEPYLPTPSPLFGPATGNMEKSVPHLQFKGRYILTSTKSGLMLIDQHLAHVRILFDRFMTQIKQRQGASQGLLFPEMIQLPPSEATVLESLWDDLAAIGFDLSPLGQGNYAINGVPAGIEGLSPVELLRNMVLTAIEQGNDVKEEIQTILTLTLARAAAIVYGQALTQEEMSDIVDRLFACDTPNYTPDRHTVLAVLKEEDIDKLFK